MFDAVSDQAMEVEAGILEVKFTAQTFGEIEKIIDEMEQAIVRTLQDTEVVPLLGIQAETDEMPLSKRLNFGGLRYNPQSSR